MPTENELRLGHDVAVAEIAYDPETGAFTWKRRAQGRKRAYGAAGRINSAGYRRIFILGVDVAAHRLAFFLVKGRWPAEKLDHRDGDPSNDRWKNLREATNAQNAANTKSYSWHGHKGVRLFQKPNGYEKWQAEIKVGGKRRHLGTFDTAEEAAAAYQRAAETAHGDYAVSRSRG